MRRLGWLVILLTMATNAWAQSTNGTITGRVTDPGKAVLPGARITLINAGTNITRSATTDQGGGYVLSNVPPGDYRIQVEKDGFKTVIKPGVIVHVQDTLEINFEMAIGALSESVTVTGGAPLVNTQDAAVSTVVDRQFVENLPMNGRSFQTLIQLTPGVVLTTSNRLDSGQFSVNGQRASSNYWMIDGVSANVGVATSNSPAVSGLSGTNAGFSVLGGTNSLVSVDAMQEFRIQTSTFAPEFGRTVGGQISIITRSGTNQFNGTLFDYFRNDALDANDWFAGFNHLPKPKERQNDFGGTFSGPVVKDRTFFFFSYEGLRLRLPRVAESLVPDLNARQMAIPAMRPFLNAFPLPNGTDDPTTGVAQFNASFADAASLDAYSLRVDDQPGARLSVFARYNDSPSKLTQRGNGTLSSLTPSQVTVHTGTAGLTWLVSPTVVNDLRFNYSRIRSKSYTFLDTFGGASPLKSLPFPPGFDANNGQMLLLWFPLFPFGGLQPGFLGDNIQRQINLLDSVSLQRGTHSWKFGVDFRRLSPRYGNPGYVQQVAFRDVPSSLAGTVFFSAITSGRSADFEFRNVGVFAQDTWRVTPALTLTYGLRWDLDVAPSSNPSLLAVTGFDLNNPSTLALAPEGTRPFHTTYRNFAPRLGVAYQLNASKNWTTVFRGGAGVFYDLATGETGNSISPNLYPFGAGSFSLGGTFPLSSAAAAPPAIAASNLQTFGAGGVFDPNLKLPYALQWSAAVEQSIGAYQTLSVTYVGSAGRRLIQTAFLPSANSTFANVQLITNAASSDYHALQMQFRRRLSRGLQALASYTWAHSFDTASAGSALGNPGNLLLAALSNQNRGPSDFDIRHSVSAAITYEIPSTDRNWFLKAIVGGWSIDNVIQARSAPPVNITRLQYSNLAGARAKVRPDLVPGQPLFLFGPQYPGGRAINPKAFTLPPTDAKGNPLRQGNLGRNALRGFGAMQWDFALHREFPIHESVRLQFRTEVFNLLNHPNFGPPVSTLGSGQFGLSTQMLGQSLNGGNLGGGALNPLYQIGGPRSVQLGVKLLF